MQHLDGVYMSILGGYKKFYKKWGRILLGLLDALARGLVRLPRFLLTVSAAVRHTPARAAQGRALLAAVIGTTLRDRV